jgi:hypothetical protein
MNDINKLPYANWLEETLQNVIKLPIKGICISAVLDGGEIYTDYHNVNMMNKLMIAGVIQQDATIDSLAASGIINYAEEDDSDGEEEV